jgi:glycosyltransferase involved in cell wall biosynthesis
MVRHQYTSETMVLLLGNYALDQQQSMQRFGAMMLEGLTGRGIEAELIVPQPIVGDVRLFGRFIQKWLGYIDKYFFFPYQLRKRVRAANQAVVHICDHSNAVYVDKSRPAAVVVTCHDLLAVRGGLGEDTDCPATVPGRFLQRWILRGLKKAEAIVCDSEATAADAHRLLGESCSRQWVNVVSLGLSYPYHPISDETAKSRLFAVPSLDLNRPFALHVGSNLRRKNRDGVLRIVATIKDKWEGQIVFAGEALTGDLLRFAAHLGIADRVVQASNLSNELLEALYNRAVALVYPSRFEGFGWPVIEAQACGCPVISSNSGPLPEVGGEAALLHPIEDEAGFAADLLRLTDPAERSRWAEKSLSNARRFSTSRMIDEYAAIYRRLGAAV